MASLNSTMNLYTAVETAEHGYTECAAKHWADKVGATTQPLLPLPRLTTTSTATTYTATTYTCLNLD